MIYKNYKFNIVLRIFLLVINTIALSYYLINTNYYIISANLVLLMIVQILMLYRYLNKVKQDLTNFFNSLKNNDSTIVYDISDKNDLFSEVYSGMNMLNRKMSQIQIDNEMSNNYSRIMAEHITLGLIVFDMDGKVELVNRAAKKLFNIESLANIESLDDIHSGFSDILRQIDPSGQKLIKISNEKENFPVLILAAEFKMKGKKKKLISLQNIKKELDEKEMLSWQKLSRVLTHEIMNSIAPISSTIKEITRMMKDSEGFKESDTSMPNEILTKTVDGLEIIEERSNSLLEFVTSYRKINSVPKPDISRVNIQLMLKGIVKLVMEEMKNSNINLSLDVEDNIFVHADNKQLQQIIINLISNSKDALHKKDSKNILIRSFSDNDGKAVIEIEDNGCGIPISIIDQIFVPFFTTRENGSGIGLSLSRQIMLLNGGNISVKSEEGKGSIFILNF